MAELEPKTRSRVWPWLLGLVLIIVVLWIAIRSFTPDAPADFDDGANTTNGVPIHAGVRAA